MTAEEAREGVDTQGSNRGVLGWLFARMCGCSRHPEHQGNHTLNNSRLRASAREFRPGTQSGDDPARIYSVCEKVLQMSRLEEHHVLCAALALLVRLTQPEGPCIRFPRPEAVDRMILASCNLPLDPPALSLLLHETFARRGLHLDLAQVTRDFVRAHGKWSKK